MEVKNDHLEIKLPHLPGPCCPHHMGERLVVDDSLQSPLHLDLLDPEPHHPTKNLMEIEMQKTIFETKKRCFENYPILGCMFSFHDVLKLQDTITTAIKGEPPKRWTC